MSTSLIVQKKLYNRKINNNSLQKAAYNLLTTNNVYEYSRILHMDRYDIECLERNFLRCQVNIHQFMNKFMLGYKHLNGTNATTLTADDALLLLSLQDIELVSGALNINGIKFPSKNFYIQDEEDILSRNNNIYDDINHTEMNSNRNVNITDDNDDDQQNIPHSSTSSPIDIQINSSFYINSFNTSLQAYLRGRMYILYLAELHQWTYQNAADNVISRKSSKTDNSVGVSALDDDITMMKPSTNSNKNEKNYYYDDDSTIASCDDRIRSDMNGDDNSYSMMDSSDFFLSHVPNMNKARSLSAQSIAGSSIQSVNPSTVFSQSYTNNNNNNGLPPLQLRSNKYRNKEIINNNDKKRLIKAGFDSSFSRATPRVLQSKTKSLQELLAIGGGSGINQNDLDELKMELILAREGIKQLDKMVDTNIAWVQNNCDMSTFTSTFSLRTKRKCKLMAAERIFNVYIDYYYETLNWSFRLWINATRYNRLKEITINYSKIKSIEILTKKFNNMIMKRLLYGLQTWLLFVKRIVYSAVLKIQCMLRKKLARMRVEKRKKEILENIEKERNNPNKKLERSRYADKFDDETTISAPAVVVPTPIPITLTDTTHVVINTPSDPNNSFGGDLDALLKSFSQEKHNDDFLNKNDTDNSTSSNKETIKASLLKSNRTIDKNSTRNLIKSQSKIKKEVINSTKKQVTVANEIISKSNEDIEQKTIEDTDQVATSTNSSDQSPKQIIKAPKVSNKKRLVSPLKINPSIQIEDDLTNNNNESDVDIDNKSAPKSMKSVKANKIVEEKLKNSKKKAKNSTNIASTKAVDLKNDDVSTTKVLNAKQDKTEEQSSSKRQSQSVVSRDSKLIDSNLNLVMNKKNISPKDERNSRNNKSPNNNNNNNSNNNKRNISPTIRPDTYRPSSNRTKSPKQQDIINDNSNSNISNQNDNKSISSKTETRRVQSPNESLRYEPKRVKSGNKSTKKDINKTITNIIDSIDNQPPKTILSQERLVSPVESKRERIASPIESKQDRVLSTNESSRSYRSNNDKVLTSYDHSVDNNGISPRNKPNNNSNSNDPQKSVVESKLEPIFTEAYMSADSPLPNKSSYMDNEITPMLSTAATTTVTSNQPYQENMDILMNNIILQDDVFTEQHDNLNLIPLSINILSPTLTARSATNSQTPERGNRSMSPFSDFITRSFSFKSPTNNTTPSKERPSSSAGSSSMFKSIGNMISNFISRSNSRSSTPQPDDNERISSIRSNISNTSSLINDNNINLKSNPTINTLVTIESASIVDETNSNSLVSNYVDDNQGISTTMVERLMSPIDRQSQNSSQASTPEKSNTNTSSTDYTTPLSSSSSVPSSLPVFNISDHYKKNLIIASPQTTSRPNSRMISSNAAVLENIPEDVDNDTSEKYQTIPSNIKHEDTYEVVNKNNIHNDRNEEEEEIVVKTMKEVLGNKIDKVNDSSDNKDNMNLSHSKSDEKSSVSKNIMAKQSVKDRKKTTNDLSKNRKSLIDNSKDKHSRPNSKEQHHISSRPSSKDQITSSPSPSTIPDQNSRRNSKDPIPKESHSRPSSSKEQNPSSNEPTHDLKKNSIDDKSTPFSLPSSSISDDDDTKNATRDTNNNNDYNKLQSLSTFDDSSDNSRINALTQNTQRSSSTLDNNSLDIKNNSINNNNSSIMNDQVISNDSSTNKNISKKTKEQIQQQAVLKIQCFIRIKLAQKRLIRKKKEIWKAQRKVGQLIVWAVKTIQRYARGKMGRTRFKKIWKQRKVR